MFLFPWLDWGIDISDFEKIDFLGHGRFSGVPSPWAGSVFFKDFSTARNFLVLENEIFSGINREV